MRCPSCHDQDTRVVDSRVAGPEQEQIRRRRQCRACGARFTTFERAEFSLPRVVKRSGERVAFDEEKLRSGLRRALHKRPVKTDDVERVIDDIKRQLSAVTAPEVKSDRIGEMVLAALHVLDHVAYIRFASIYLSFASVQSFREAIERLEDDLSPEMRRSQMRLIDEEAAGIAPESAADGRATPETDGGSQEGT
ncbi:transcriptional regulator NrdR [Thioalkalivibrio sp. ALM2T]|uniref:transcriptional regulator NrdR n=1 Tax=Thioalkalivibrio sp. ALM2T TaxID=1158184 RepID=UPI000476C579|nr:transcriptional regulator NrdR [Thioalkalivibrio sp. ALM2T]